MTLCRVVYDDDDFYFYQENMKKDRISMDLFRGISPGNISEFK